MTPEEFARDSWQTASATTALPPLEELRARADKFRRQIARRNWIEYAAGLFVIIAFGVMTFVMPVPAMRIGSAMVVGGTCVLLWQLHKRGTPLTPPTHGGQLSVMEYRRCDLAKQRDALDSIFTWYLLPLIPGMLVLIAAPFLSTSFDEWQMPPADFWLAVAFIVAVFGGVYALNKWAARKLQQEIDEIDALLAE